MIENHGQCVSREIISNRWKKDINLSAVSIDPAQFLRVEVGSETIDFMFSYALTGLFGTGEIFIRLDDRIGLTKWKRTPRLLDAEWDY